MKPSKGTDKQIGIRLSGISKAYRKADNRKSAAVKSLNLNIHMGEVTALVGNNGAGKSTLL